MSGNRILVDTNILIYLMDGDTKLADILDGSQIYISFITELELYAQKTLSVTEKTKIDNVLSLCSIIDINAGIKSSTIAIRQVQNVKLPDCIIAATAIYLGLPLMTADWVFKKIPELDLLTYQV